MEINLNELATALAKAQAMMEGAKKDAANPFYKSRYADLESVWIACRKALTDNGLSVVQYGGFRATVEGVAVFPTIVTRLLHSSGQWIEGETPVRAKDDSPQALGSAITYARRYGLAAMVGVYQTDDDAEAAQGRPAQPQVAKHDFSPMPDTTGVSIEFVAKYLKDFRDGLASRNDQAVAKVHADLNQEGQEEYAAVWKQLTSGERAAIKNAEMRVREMRPAKAF